MMWLLGLWLCSMMVKGELVENLSFQKPFELISSDGDRKVSKDWQHGGTTVVNSHFIRLTIDRQSKRGWIWNTNKINMEEFSIIFTFRISGSSEKLFGDGVGLWITNVPSYTEGDLHAFSRKYTGVGIIFDTFYNTENKGGHKDVTVLVNNGQKGGVDMLQDETVLGCDIPSLRYYEKSAKFNPSKSMSRAKVQYKLGKLTVKVDASNSGTWTDCYTTNVQLPKGWTNAATLGVTASTGTLADNHDVIGLAMFNKVEDEKHAAYDQKVLNSTAVKPVLNELEGSESDRIAQLQLQLAQMRENFEHQFTSLQEKTSNTIMKLKAQEEEDEKRIVDLENMVNGKVSMNLNSKLGNFQKQVDNKLDESVKKNIKAIGTWHMPFYVLLFALCIAAGVVYKKYQEIRKSHLL